jgi:hypothetical protein
MTHLSREQMAEAAEHGAAYGAHLGACPACRQQVDEMRRVLASAREIDVPEPSPLFWTHFSDRVRETVASEPVPQRPFVFGFRWAAALAAALAVMVGVAVTMRTAPQVVTDIVPQPAAELEPLVPLEDDVSLAFMGELAAQMDWDAAAEAGLAAGPGSAERAIQGLSPDERQLVVELLEEEIQKSKSL